MDLLTELAILVLAAFVGFEVISKVPNTLHTPLMSGTNAIHGIVLLGGLLVIGAGRRLPRGRPRRDRDRLRDDQRRRRLPRHRPHARDVQVEARAAQGARGVSRDDVIQLLYIVAFSMFIIGLHMLRGPRTAVRGNQVAAVGMAIAVVATLIDQRIGDWGLIVVGLVIGTAIGVPSARSVRMTAMPQMVALFNGVGGGAVALISVVEYKESLEARRQPRARGADPDPVRRDHRLDLVLGLEHRVPQAPGDRSRAASRSRAQVNAGARRADRRRRRGRDRRRHRVAGCCSG